jgi:DNA-binding transcriptional LysR family regulator
VLLNKLKIVAHFDNVQSIKQTVKENMGLAIISEIAALDYKESGFINVYELVELNERRTFYFGYHKKKSLPSYISEFIAFGKNMITFLPWNTKKNPLHRDHW